MRDVEMRIHRAEVMSAEDLTPSLRRIVLGGEGLADFESTGLGDEYVRVFLPDRGESEPRLPFPVGRGWEYPDGVAPAELRTYTVRRFHEQRGEVTLDFVLHGGGVAATWAQEAKRGDVVGLNSPTGLYDAADDLAWQLLVTDLTGMPAALRILQQTPEHVCSRVVFEVPGPEHRWEKELPAGVDVTWMHGGNGVAPSRIEQAVRTAPRPDGPGYVWVVGESRVLRAVRRYVRHELGLPASAYKVVAYWTERAEEWNARFAALNDNTKSELFEMWNAEDRDPEEIEDDYLERLGALGL